jgi:hypothetical protein
VRPSGGDDSLYPDKRASFSKTLPYDDLGDVDPAAFAKFVDTVANGSIGEFGRLPRAPRAVEQLNDPLAISAFAASGVDSASIPLPPPRPFATSEEAAEIAELYWLALIANTPLRCFETDPLRQAAAHDLRALSAAPVFGDTASSETDMLFRGRTGIESVLTSASSSGSTSTLGTRKKVGCRRCGKSIVSNPRAANWPISQNAPPQKRLSYDNLRSRSWRPARRVGVAADCCAASKAASLTGLATGRIS